MWTVLYCYSLPVHFHFCAVPVLTHCFFIVLEARILLVATLNDLDTDHFSSNWPPSGLEELISPSPVLFTVHGSVVRSPDSRFRNESS